MARQDLGAISCANEIIAIAAVERLVERLASNAIAARSVLLPDSIVVRGSSG